MGTAIRSHRNDTRHGERIRLHARLQISTEGGKPVAPLARCTEIGMGGMRVEAAEGLRPGTRVQIEVILPSGRRFASPGRVAWARQTVHLALFGSPRGRDDDALFGIAFDECSREALLPIARLFLARDHERARARRIRRLHGLAIRA